MGVETCGDALLGCPPLLGGLHAFLAAVVAVSDGELGVTKEIAIRVNTLEQKTRVR
jgi:hypothetical protein